MINFDYETTIDQVRNLLLDYEIPPHLAGFNLIAEAVTIKLAKPYSSIKDIYSAVAAGCSRTVDTVIRNVNYAIKQSYNLGNILNIPKQQIFGGRVISVLAIHIKSMIAPPPPMFCGVSYKQQKNRTTITDRPIFPLPISARSPTRRTRVRTQCAAI